ncbi:replication-relaxation family protein [Kitasatospora sp. NPDC096077]|uniref:replication-relaxation family protein n=1 Tax=Kitasatospora sp. NPDC096077 TaxID=3155544 RepID=UPI00332B7567
MLSHSPPTRPGRTAYRRCAANPNGSTTALRADVLGALGVLKVATADQLQRLLRPRAASNTVIRQALRDLALHGLVASDGNTRDRHQTWRLEGTAGLEAAGHVLGLPRSGMGSTARGAGRSGAQHAMAVNETITAFVLGGTAPDAGGLMGVLTGPRWAKTAASIPRRGASAGCTPNDSNDCDPANTGACSPAYFAPRPAELQQLGVCSPDEGESCPPTGCAPLELTPVSVYGCTPNDSNDCDPANTEACAPKY